ncbi:uracil-DNA glycosylase [Candidatus Kinetoplastidibacterium crithidiae]|uniref:Uracil-DNA glycosylase n=1 Tax=Candidatus Kinetoplastidibacterium crithidiae TCC036E TaxID=1208918 RepID=M1LV28_9PROT|nr:uracil-DNA glycosylase [Candidatus Kinetoplastibacterium crithidii]AFZ82952.1 uracil-DNA glycosylase [Candidatus Kinetoplastibacterium crithidii (ex Angomonas deanei ATCC 30255)]AGF47951.1 uracil-DNA glycosylase [Candidatus Kinetoplastibacterium crithidii TCC036E]
MSNKLIKKTLYKDFNNLNPIWKNCFLQNKLEQSFKEIFSYVESEIDKGVTIYPANPFRSLYNIKNLSEINVVILGQDPYHNEGQADGLAFSVPANCTIPPSLRNINKELKQEYNNDLETAKDLSFWAMQGVLLLNTILTVEHGKAMSHANKGWELITDTIIKLIATNNSPKAFLLWGLAAQKKTNLITNNVHLILKSNHPSPLSAYRKPFPFIGCNHFIKTNEWLISQKRKPITWLIPKK